jgi:hypothetical protein
MSDATPQAAAGATPLVGLGALCRGDTARAAAVPA